MANMVSVTGGLYTGVALNSAESATAQRLLASIDSSYTSGEIHSSTTQPADTTAGVFNVYQITPTEGQVVNEPTGAQAIVLEGSNDATLNLTAGATNAFAIGNSGDDTINTNGASGTVILGGGDNTLNIGSGSVNVYTGPGNDTFNDTGGNLYIQGTGSNTVNVSNASTYIYDSTSAQINAYGNDTITLGTGTDTVTSFGSATIVGGSGDLVFQGDVNSTVTAGAGDETLFGGTGTTIFYGSSQSNGSESMVGGSGTNYFEGSDGRDTMVSGASSGASSDIFDFSSTVSGGNHTIVGYTAGTDTVQLQGYTAGDVDSIKTVSGSTVIALDDGTSITLKGVTSFSSSDIKFTS